MYISPEFLHYSTIASIVSISSISVGMSQGITSFSALEAISRQPSARNDIMRVATLGMAIIETVAILALLIGALMLFGKPFSSETNYYVYASEFGITCALSLSSLVVGLACALPAQAACRAIARQPFAVQPIFSFMLMTQVLIQTPILSAFLVSLFIQWQSAAVTTLNDSLRLIASGLCIGLGSIGPAIGLGLFAKAGIDGLGTNAKSYKKLLSFTLISEAIIETPIIFCLLVSLILLFFVPRTELHDSISGVIFISAAFCLGMGTLGAGISSGRTGAAACTQIANNPENASVISRTSMLAQGLIETIVIYATLLSLVMILFR